MHHPTIPYFETSRYRVATMIELAEIKQGEIAADLGSGDGRITIALAEAGAQVHGFEVDEQLIESSKFRIENEGLSCFIPELVEGSEMQPTNASTSPAKQDPLSKDNKKHIFLHQTDFWTVDLSPYQIITIYPMPDIMDALEKKLMKELQPEARILLNYYQFPTWKLEKTKDHIYLYKR